MSRTYYGELSALPQSISLRCLLRGQTADAFLTPPDSSLFEEQVRLKETLRSLNKRVTLLENQSRLVDRNIFKILVQSRTDSPLLHYLSARITLDLRRRQLFSSFLRNYFSRSSGSPPSLHFPLNSTTVAKRASPPSLSCIPPGNR